VAESWTSEEALEHALDVYADYFFTQVRKRSRGVELGRYLVARWGLNNAPHEMTLYASDELVYAEHYDDAVELSGGRGLRMATFRAADAQWALHYFRALHQELDDEAGRCVFEDPRCPRYEVTAPDEASTSSTPIHVDFTRFTAAGIGTIYGPEAAGLRVGQIIAITDDDADTIEAEVLEVRRDAAKVRARWDTAPPS